MGKPVAKLKIMCARSMHEVVTALADDFTSETGHEVELSFGTVGALQKRLDAGETADVVISSIPALEGLEKAGRLFADFRKNIATVQIGLAIREGTPAADISTPAAFKQTLIAARRIAFSDAAVGGSAGVYLARMFVDLGLQEMIREKGLPQRSGGEVAQRVADGEADIGMTLIAEIVPVKGARVLGPLPAPLGNATTYCAGVMATSGAPDAARAFIDALRDPETSDTWTEAGFEAPTPLRRSP
jgi:molybdate transport system substrate-binding protein